MYAILLHVCPVKMWIQSLLDVGKDEIDMVKRVLEYNLGGHNCLIIAKYLKYYFNFHICPSFHA